MSPLPTTCLTRRAAVQGAFGLALAGVSLPSIAAAQSAAAVDGLDRFQTYMKLYSSLEPGEHWWWFKGHWDVIPSTGQPQPLVGQDTLIRRQVRKDEQGRYVTRGWEGMVFSDLGTGQPVDQIVNPASGRQVYPFHSKEGPTTTVSSTQGIELGAGTSNPRTLPMDFPTTVAGDDLWLQRAFRFSVPHPMAAEDWPVESSGAPYWTNMETVFRARVSDIRNPDVVSAPTDFLIFGQSVTVPWLAMGRDARAAMGWAGFGKKLHTLDEMPATNLSWFEKYHPELFSSEEPWVEHTNPFVGYMRDRKPLAEG